MAEFKINVSDEERVACLKAVKLLNDIPHIKSMSIAAIAESASIKATKCRAVLDDLVDKEYLMRMQVTDNRKVQRYYYVILPEGSALLGESST